MSVRLVCVLGAAGLLVVGCGSSKKDTPAPTPTNTAEVDSAPPPEPPECKNPVDVLLYGKDPTGYQSCDGAGVYRKEQIDCPSKIPRTTTCGNGPTGGDAAAPADCRADTDCTTKPNGYCTVNSRSSYCYCAYGCVKDEDCGDGYVCSCGDPVGTCVKATCHSDADCNGRHCLRSLDENCNFIFACQEATDPCTVNKDCPANTPACSVIAGKRTCTTTFACK